MIVVADKDTNSLTVRDTAENVRLIGELIQSIDKDRAEVVMDVDIYEVSQSDLLQFGNQIGTGSGIFNLGGSPGLSILSSSGAVNSSQPGVNLSNIVGQVPTALAAALVIPPAVFSAFQSKDNTKLIASTQVHAFNGEESKARIGQRVPVQTAQAYPFGVQTGTPQPGQGAFPTGGFPVINYEPTGLTLTFTPQVFPNLDVQVKMNIESKDVLGGETLTPTFTERTITGTARVQNTRTMLLASVSQDVETKGRRGIAFLGGLPILGRLFTSPTRSNRRVDIVIAVTPRVLRAPALTPRDEEMRPSGTLQSPTTGSLEAMLRENDREEQILAARRIPKEVNVQLPDAPAYVPAASTETQTQAANNNGGPTQATTVAQNNGAAKTEPVPVTTKQAAATNGTNSPAANDSTMPQPKAASFAPQTPATETNKLDVATAIKNVVTPTTEVTATSATAKTDANVTAPVEDLAPKSAVTDATAKSAPLPAVIELGFASEQTQLTVGEKRQISLELNSPAPLGVAVVMLRFDPSILKVTNVTAGKMLADAKFAPTISVMKNEGGVLLVSITPAAGATISGEGALLNLEVEGLAGGNSSLAFDLSSVHVVTADGSASVVQVSSPVIVAVKAAAAAAKP